MNKKGKYTVAAVGGGVVGATVGGLVFGGLSSIALGFLAGVAGGIVVVKVAVKIAEMTDKPDTSRDNKSIPEMIQEQKAKEV